MTEELKPKQFLVVVDELSLAFLSKLIPSLQFVQVEGMSVPGDETKMILVNPLPQRAKEDAKM